MYSKLLVTGGCGFIGSAFIRTLLRSSNESRIVNLDAMTYAANVKNLDGFHEHPKYRMIQGDINNMLLVDRICSEYEIEAIVHFAAETHVDRSIADSFPFFETNVKGTLSLLEVVRRHPHIHFHHVSTDEVYGSLGEGGLFNEQSNYRPNSPYAASKAASDHFVRAYAHTHGLFTTISHCSNNYGPGQHPEKFIPHMISNCLLRKPLPIYGTGLNVRDWIYVDDHVEGILAILERGGRGETYNIGGECELSNIELLRRLIDCLAQEKKELPESYTKLIRFVKDRPGHDFRYAIDNSKMAQQLKFSPKTKLEDGLRKTIRHYARN